MNSAKQLRKLCETASKTVQNNNEKERKAVSITVQNSNDGLMVTESFEKTCKNGPFFQTREPSVREQ